MFFRKIDHLFFLLHLAITFTGTVVVNMKHFQKKLKIQRLLDQMKTIESFSKPRFYNCTVRWWSRCPSLQFSSFQRRIVGMEKREKGVRLCSLHRRPRLSSSFVLVFFPYCPAQAENLNCYWFDSLFLLFFMHNTHSYFTTHTHYKPFLNQSWNARLVYISCNLMPCAELRRFLFLEAACK